MALLLMVVARTLASAQQIEWTRQFGTDNVDQASGVAEDATGIYVAGFVFGALPGQSSGGLVDAFVRKYDSSGNTVWTRQFGTASGTTAIAIAVNVSGVYVVGDTDAALPGQTSAGSSDAFVRKYDANGSEQWTRQFGTSGSDAARAVAVDDTGIYVAGDTSGAMPGQTSAGTRDAFVRKYNVNGDVVWTRQFGTAGEDRALGGTANATGVYITGFVSGALAGQSSAGGQDAFVRKYDANGGAVWTRQFGSAGEDRALGGTANATELYIAGYATGALAGQTSAGDRDAFVRKYDANGSETWTRQFGTASFDEAAAVTLDATGAYAAGRTMGILPGQTSAGFVDAFGRKYDPNGAEQWTRQFGSAGTDAALGIAATASAVYVAGTTDNTLPGQTTAGEHDAFIAKLTPPPATGPAVFDGGVVNAASFALHPAPLAPGTIASVFGTNLNDGSIVPSSTFGLDGKLVTTLGGASVQFNGTIAAPMFSSIHTAQFDQLTVQIPYELAGQTTATVQVTMGGQTSAPRTVFLAAGSPGIFTANQQGSGPGAVTHVDGSLITTQNPARRDEVVILYATGLGVLSPPLATGSPSAGNETAIPATVTVDGASAQVLFSGSTPGLVGLNQLNLRIPASTRAAPDIQIVVRVGAAVSNTATIAVQ